MPEWISLTSFCHLPMPLLNVLSRDLHLSALAAAFIALATSLIAGPVVIRWLKLGLRERIASDSARLAELHAAKRDTPTMGGLLIVAAVIVGVSSQVRLNSPFVWIALFVTLALMAVGGYDDLIKLRTSRKGLSVFQKLAAQLVIAVVASVGLFLFCDRPQTPSSAAGPMLRQILSSGWLLIPWATLVIVATSNAVNLTDGLDGLAAGCTFITGTALTIIIAGFPNSATATATAGEAAVFSAALSGSVLGFLWYNRYPARVFMGDTGSLPLGGLLAVTAIACGIELTLLLTGVVFVAETLSVILQVCWYRRTGRRILRCSPLHNHFVFLGNREPRIVAAFWTVAAVGAAIGLFISL